MVDLSKFIDNSLKSEFEAKPYNIEKDRAKLIARFNGAKSQFPSSKAPNKIWKLANGVVEVKVPVGSGNLNINGATTNYVPEGQFAGFIDALIEAANAGEFDGALKAVQTAPQTGQRASTSGAGKFSSLTGVKRSVGKMKGKTDKELRDYLSSAGVPADWIDEAIKNRAK